MRSGAALRSDRFGGRLCVRGAFALGWTALWLGSHAAVRAQVSVAGEALDRTTGLPVAGAIVHFPDLGIGAISDDLGYFALASVPLGTQVMAVHRVGYVELEEEVRIAPGEIWEVLLTPSAVAIRGLAVTAPTGPEAEAARTGRRSDFLSPTTVAEAAERTDKLLGVLRSKAPPRLRIRQEGGPAGVSFCVESSRRRPSVHEMTESGVGCRPVLLALDGVIVYAPPRAGVASGLPADVAAVLLNQDPREVRSVRVLSPADAFFRYGEAGRAGAVEIATVRPGRPGA